MPSIADKWVFDVTEWSHCYIGEDFLKFYFLQIRKILYFAHPATTFIPWPSFFFILFSYIFLFSFFSFSFFSFFKTANANFKFCKSWPLFFVFFIFSHFYFLLAEIAIFFRSTSACLFFILPAFLIFSIILTHFPNFAAAMFVEAESVSPHLRPPKHAPLRCATGIGPSWVSQTRSFH